MNLHSKVGLSGVAKVILLLITISFASLTVVMYQRDVANPQPALPPLTYLIVEVHALKSTVETSQIQILAVKVHNASKPVVGMPLAGLVEYPKGGTKTFQGITDNNGTSIYSWRVEENAGAGEVKVKVTIPRTDKTAAGIGLTSFAVKSTFGNVDIPPYRGQITFNGVLDNESKVQFNIRFAPPTKSGVVLFLMKPDGNLGKAILADPGNEMAALSPVIELQIPGEWRVWILSDDAKSRELKFTVPAGK